MYDDRLHQLGAGQREFPSIFPRDGWVEQDANQLWDSVLESCREAIANSGVSVSAIDAIGITNQRETSIVWDSISSEPVGNAIVWQDRRTADLCQKVLDDGLEERIAERTGLVVDPYFSSTKLSWLLQREPYRELADANRLKWGTVDSFLLWRLTQGQVHATDDTNASRTQLYDIIANEWSEELLDYFGVPWSVLPTAQDSCSFFGTTHKDWFGKEIPILGIAGDQQSALIGQVCCEPGMAKSTYGTGCFLITNTGSTKCESKSKLLSTIAYRIDGVTTYAVEGSIFNAGTAIQWVRDNMNFIENSAESEAAARRVDGETNGVFVVPAFTGLGAPHWEPNARGLICGLTLDTSTDEIVTATLKSVGFQTADLVAAVQNDEIPLDRIRVDGGMVGNDWFCQFLSDITGLQVDRPKNVETTSVGAAILALLGLGRLSNLRDAARLWTVDSSFYPTMSESDRVRELERWHTAIARAL